MNLGNGHCCNGHELGQTLGGGEGWRGLVCCVHGVVDTVAMDMNLGKLWEVVRDGEAWCAVSMG